MKRGMFIILFCALSVAVSAQVTVEECWRLARENYPLIARAGLIDQARDYTVANASKGYLPQLTLAAKASYQSDVTSVALDVPGVDIPTLPKDNYDAHVELQQVIWDGGRIRAGRLSADASAAVERQSLEVDLYALRERVDQLFFGILLLDAQLEQNRILNEDLGRSYDQVKAYVASGVANRSDLDAVQVERVNSRQNRASLSSTRDAYAAMLGAMTGIKGEISLVAPSVDIPVSSEVNRPEISLFKAQEELYRTKLKSISAGNLPTLGAYAQGGYGQPGLNMFKTGFEPYWLVGARLTWSFGSLYTRKGDRRLVDNSLQNVAAQRETFLFNTNLNLTRQQRKVGEIKQLLADDDEVVSLRVSMRQAAQAKAAAGTLSVTELMRQVMAEDIARQNRLLHQVQLMMAVYDIKVTTNN